MGKFLGGLLAGIILTLAIVGSIYNEVSEDIQSGEIKNSAIEVVKDWLD